MMAPSRGNIERAVIASDDEAAVQQQASSALISAKRNLNYLISPNNSERPARFRTRALLRTVRYVGQFIIWRVVRWAKYVAVGALVAGVSATVGGFLSPIAWIAAPTSIGASIVAAGVWGVGRFAAARLHARWKKDGGDIGEQARERQEDQARDVRLEGTYGIDVGPKAVPW
jgi:hypothetical protein